MGHRLESLTWMEAEAVLTASATVVIPLGAAAKEHGPHLKLSNDLVMARYLAERILERCDVVLAPAIPYHYFPAFVEYPGSVSLRLETARDLVVDVCRSLARFGPRRFYVLNTGISTVRALEPASRLLAADGLMLGWTDLAAILGPIERLLCEQAGGSHADESETSMMLCIAPELVDMTRAVEDYDAVGKGALTRVKGASGTYSPSGVWGNPTLASREKGQKLLEALVDGIVSDLEVLGRD